MRYLTSDLAKLLGVTTNTIRRYENSGFLNPKRDTSNYRWYEHYDISKTAMVRLYIKCGFSHEEIRSIIGNDSQSIRNICTERLQNIDNQIERLKRLRHWLKDNIQLMDRAQELKDSFYIMDCTALRYVVFSIGDEILNERGRLDTIKYFMYEAPEVKLMNIFKLDDLEKGSFIPYTAWTIKEVDVEKFNMRDIVNTNKYIEFYPSLKSLFGTIEISAQDVYDDKKTNQIRKEYLKKVKKYIDENNYRISGDMLEVLVNGLGNTVSILVCLPIAPISQN